MPQPFIPRRHLLRHGACLAAMTAAPAWLTPATATSSLSPTPAQTEGPFYPVSLPPDRDFDLLRNGALSYTHGQATWIEGTVTDTRGVAVAGALVEIWQCDHNGRYHHPGDGGRADASFQGFGQVSIGRDGHYRFRTIRPVAYSGRTPHIHVKVRLDGHDLLTTQMYVQGDPHNERDFLWRRLNAAGRQALTRRFEAGTDGLRAHFPIVVQA